MNAQFSWELAPWYDLVFNCGPSGEHPLDLASNNGLKGMWAAQIIEQIAQAIEMNRTRMLV